MAVTRLSNVIVPEVFDPYVSTHTKTKSAIFESGVLAPSEKLANDLAGGGTTFQAPAWNDLTDNESDIASDDPNTSATPDNITAFKASCIRQVRTKGWSDADLVSQLAGSDPMTEIGNKVAGYWRRQYQAALVNTLRGVFADNIANDSGDMVYDATTAVGAFSTSMCAENIIECKQTMGDASDGLALIIMHSRMYSNLQRQNLIDFIPNSDGKIMFPTYLGYRVVQDDQCPIVSTKYYTFLLAPGSVGWAEHAVDVPVETFRYPAKGNGAGVEELWTRKQFIMHPTGFHWAAGSVAGQFPTNTELRTATNWDRKAPERKQVGMALLITDATAI